VEYPVITSNQNFCWF